MVEVEKYIIDLILKNDCVIIPNLGGFISNYEPAKIDLTNKKIYPPNRIIIFNPLIQNNDGLLINYISLKNSINYFESSKIVENLVSTWRNKLNANERVELGEIGFIFKKNDKLIFEQNKDFIASLDSYGLNTVNLINFESVKEVKALVDDKISQQIKVEEKISIKKLEEKKPKIKEISVENIITLQPKIEKTFEEQSALENEESVEKNIIPINQTKNKVSWKYIAVACFLPLIFYLYWIPMNTTFLETGNIKLSDFNPFQAQYNNQYTKRLDLVDYTKYEKTTTIEEIVDKLNPDVELYNYKFDEELYIPVHLKTTNNSIAKKQIENKPSNNISTTNSKKIHLIAGCFSKENNANTLINNLKELGYKNARILDKNKGLFRVTTGEFNSIEEAEKEKSSLEIKDIPTWVLK